MMPEGRRCHLMDLTNRASEAPDERDLCLHIAYYRADGLLGASG
jgi:hypothetical protein